MYSMELANMVNPFNDCLANIHDRVDQDQSDLTMQMMLLDILGLLAMDEHGPWKCIVDAGSNRLTTMY